jgi:hypothetical protein
MKNLFILLLVSNLAYSSEKELSKVIGEINSNFLNFKSLSCPGFRLVRSCGNRICEKKKNETKVNCPSDCDQGQVHSYNHLTICRNIKSIYTPKTSKEIQDVIAIARKKKIKVKIVGAKHSASNIMCTDGLMIDMSNYNKIIGLEDYLGEKTVKVQGGVIISDLAEWLHKRNLSLGYSLMGFRGVTMAGAIGTGSHGSSPKHRAIISNLVKSVKVINAFGISKTYNKLSVDQNIFKGLKASLGLLGVITELRFKVIPQFNLDVKVSTHKDNELLKENGIFNVVSDCDYGQLNWFPGTGKFVKTCGHETTAPAEKGANNVLLDPNLPNALAKPFKQVLQLGACSNKVSCLIEKMRYLMFKLSPPFVKEVKGKIKHVKRVTGPSHRMISSNLTAHQTGFFQMDWEIAVPASKAHLALKKVYAHLKENKICLPLVGVFIRYAPSEDKTLIAHTASGGNFKKGEPVVFIEIPTYLPVGFEGKRYKDYHQPYKDFAKFLIEDFNGRAHWGKNREWAFLLQKKINAYDNNFLKFQDVVNKMDPNRIFSNKLSTSLGI